MEALKTFSTEYANAVSAVAACGALLLALVTLLFVMREYKNRYRPYVVPVVLVEPIVNSTGFAVSVIPRNVGPHPCEFKIQNIRLDVGDETYETPNFKEWVLAAPQGMEVRVPIGHVNEIGIQKVRDARYKSNRIEVSFSLITRATDKRFESKKSIAYDIGVQGEVPVVQFRPEWHKST